MAREKCDHMKRWSGKVRYIDEGPTKNQYNQDNLEHHLAFAEFVRERSSHRGAIAEILGGVDMNDTLDDE